jgi:hypothetical protein
MELMENLPIRLRADSLAERAATDLLLMIKLRTGVLKRLILNTHIMLFLVNF